MGRLNAGFFLLSTSMSGARKAHAGQSMGATHFLNSTGYSCVTPNITDKVT